MGGLVVLFFCCGDGLVCLVAVCLYSGFGVVILWFVVFMVPVGL